MVQGRGENMCSIRENPSESMIAVGFLQYPPLLAIFLRFKRGILFEKGRGSRLRGELSILK